MSAMLHATIRSLTVCFCLCVGARGQESASDPHVHLGKQLHAPDNAPKRVQWTLCVGYGDDRFDYLDQASWLSDIQARYGDRGLAVVVGARPDVAARIAASHPGFGVAEAELQLPPVAGAVLFQLYSGNAGDAVTWTAPDNCTDRIEAALALDLARTAPSEVDSLLDSLMYRVGDGGDFAEAIAHCVKSLPHSGRARALQVLEQWWCKGDYHEAQRLFDAAMTVIGSDPIALVPFADLTLRGDHTNRSMAKTLVVALAPAAATAPRGAVTQLVYLRALLLAGQDRLAGRVAAQLPQLLGDSGMLQLWFAETLMEARSPPAFRDLADRALSLAAASAVEPRLIAIGKHKVLVRCGADAEAITKLLSDYRGDSSYAGSLNNDAWYLATQVDTMGRFDPFALAQVDEMCRLEGLAMDHGNKDTVALVVFCNGQFERAAELQTAANEGSGSDRRYAARLKRYESALASTREAGVRAGENKR